MAKPDVDEKRRAQLEKMRQAIVKHIEWARTGDSDLASVRELSEFKKPFER